MLNTRSTARRGEGSIWLGGQFIEQCCCGAEQVGQSIPCLRGNSDDRGVLKGGSMHERVDIGFCIIQPAGITDQIGLRQDQDAPRIVSKSMMARCSRVWGITPSSAAMTIHTASISCPPASMFSTKSRCPGTSTMPTSPPGSVNHPNPRSMVISRTCSSFRRSGWIPVSAAISVDLPWST